MKGFDVDPIRGSEPRRRTVRPRDGFEVMEPAEFERRIEAERARVSGSLVGHKANVFEAHPDPFGTAIEAEVA